MLFPKIQIEFYKIEEANRWENYKSKFEIYGDAFSVLSRRSVIFAIMLCHQLFNLATKIIFGSKFVSGLLYWKKSCRTSLKDLFRFTEWVVELTYDYNWSKMVSWWDQISSTISFLAPKNLLNLVDKNIWASTVRILPLDELLFLQFWKVI